jgi:hypothetical protein
MTDPRTSKKLATQFGQFLIDRKSVPLTNDEKLLLEAFEIWLENTDRLAHEPGAIAPETGALVRRFRNAVDAFLTSASNPGRAAAVLHDNTPGSPYHELVMAKIEIDAMLDAPAQPPRAIADLAKRVLPHIRHTPQAYAAYFNDYGDKELRKLLDELRELAGEPVPTKSAAPEWKGDMLDYLKQAVKASPEKGESSSHE